VIAWIESGEHSASQVGGRSVKKLYAVIIVMIILCCAGYGGAADLSGLAGHYYLHGVQEVGSELILHPNGGYQWMLAYGADEFVSKGSWTHEQGRVVLQADPAQEGGALFSFEETHPIRPWDADAEKFLQERQLHLEKNRILARCPFLDTADYASAPKNEQDVSQAELERKARAALAELERAKLELERTARDAVGASSQVQQLPQEISAVTSPEAAMRKAVAAMDRYQNAWLFAKESHWAVRWPIPARSEPVFPAQCTMPPEPVIDRDKPDTWKGGMAVVVGNAGEGLKFSGIQVEFVFSDGRTEKYITGRSGMVALPLRSSAILQKIMLGTADGSRGAETLLIPPAGSAKGTVYMVHFNSKGLEKPFFTSMELIVKGTELYFPTIDGSYARQ
jgi:hypothetical protein